MGVASSRGGVALFPGVGGVQSVTGEGGRWEMREVGEGERYNWISGVT